jgi:hypothetical protein
VHPLDAKFAVADALSAGLESMRAHFEANPDLLEAVTAFTGP